VKLIIPQKIADKARRQAKHWFPQEAYLELIGSISKNNKVITIMDTWIPPDLSEFTSPGQIDINPAWRKESEKYAESIGGIVIGTIHSHPYNFKECLHSPAYRLDPSPSSCDLDNMGNEVMGILVICQNKEGRFTTNLRIYGPILKLDVRYYK
jgi:hypothetical protein